jgi:hypothetical protein
MPPKRKRQETRKCICMKNMTLVNISETEMCPHKESTFVDEHGVQHLHDTANKKITEWKCSDCCIKERITSGLSCSCGWKNDVPQPKERILLCSCGFGKMKCVGGGSTEVFYKNAKFEDEKGKHNHDKNKYDETWECNSCGKYIEVQVPFKCPNPKCNWVQEIGNAN